MTRHTPTDAARSPALVYRWTCPICGSSRAGIAAADEHPREKARFSLVQHVRATDGDGHGPANALPEGFDRDVADGCISTG